MLLTPSTTIRTMSVVIMTFVIRSTPFCSPAAQITTVITMTISMERIRMPGLDIISPKAAERESASPLLSLPENIIPA